MWHPELPTGQVEFLWFAEVSIGTSNIFFYKATHTEYLKMLWKSKHSAVLAATGEGKALKNRSFLATTQTFYMLVRTELRGLCSR